MSIYLSRTYRSTRSSDTIGRDPERLKRLLHTLMRSGATEVNTYGFWLDKSRLGLADLADDDTYVQIIAFQGGNPEAPRRRLDRRDCGAPWRDPRNG